MTVTTEPLTDTIEGMLDAPQDADAERYARQYAHVEPPRWAIEVDDWQDHGHNGDNLLRACQTEEHPLGEDGGYVYALGMQRPDGTLDDLQIFIHSDSDGVTLAQSRSLAAALVALADSIERTK